MAIDVTGLYAGNQRYHRLSSKECAAAFSVAEHTRSVEESKRLNTLRGPMILVAGAGMLTGGRILHHLTAFGSDARNTILLAGHQAAGTRGSDLVEGEGTLKIHGRSVRIRAEVVTFPGLSAHADQSELLQWIGAMPSLPRRVFLVHGEPREADVLRRVASETRGLSVQVAQDGRTVTLD
jgi:metallo-beta-lactamase family protein